MTTTTMTEGVSHRGAGISVSAPGSLLLPKRYLQLNIAVLQKSRKKRDPQKTLIFLLLDLDRGGLHDSMQHLAGLAEHPLLVNNAAKHCNRAESNKVKADGPPCEQKGWGFSPFALSTWGGLGSSAKAVLFEVTKRATADLGGWPKTQALLEIRERLSVTLMRQVARKLSLKNRVQGALSPW